MIRNLKALGLALVAVFAISAVVASAASAATPGMLTSDGPITLNGTETGAAGSNSLTMFTHSVECPGSVITGHKSNVQPHELIPSGSTTVTVTPHYNQGACKVVDLGLPATVDMNGCEHGLRVNETVPLTTRFAISYEITCPAGKVIEVTMFSSSSEALKLCTIKIKGQTGLTGAHAINTPANASTKDDIDITGTIAGIHAERSGLCLNEGGDPNTEANGKFDIDITVKGFNAAGVETGVTVSD